MKPQLLTAKELASAARVTVRTIYEMKRRGFKMPGGTATLEELRAWQNENPRPFSKHWKN